MYFIRFLPPNENAERIFRPQDVERFEQPPDRTRAAPVSPSRTKRASGNMSTTVFPKSVSVAHLLRAGKLIKPLKSTALQLELLMLRSVNRSVNGSTLDFIIKNESFSSGAFRDAFKDHLYLGDWVVKKCKPTSIETITELLKSTSEGHTRKQVQMRAEARNLTTRFSSKVPANFGDSFQCGKVFYSVLDDLPVTVEEFVPGEYRKYVNNNGAC